MSFPINTNIPAATNYPGDDQPRMQANFSNINSYLTVDHVLPGAAGNGFHKQVTIASENVPGGLPTDPASILYTNVGTASAVAQLFWSNQNSIFHMSPIRAWGFVVVDTSHSTQVITQSFNVATVKRNTGGTPQGKYVVTLTAGAVNSDQYGVLVSSQMATNFTTGVIPGYEIVAKFPAGPGQFQLNFHSLTASVGIDPDTFSFLVMQI